MMSRSSRACALGLLVGLGWLLGPRRAEASLVQALSLEELVAQSDEIFVGEVRASDTRWDDRRRIVTDATLLVERSLKGSATAGASVIVRRLGGVIGELGMQIAGEPTLLAGRRYLVFGRRHGGVLRAVGMQQGVLEVREDGHRTVVVPTHGGARLVRPAARGALGDAPGPIEARTPLDDVATRVGSLLTGRRAP